MTREERIIFSKEVYKQCMDKGMTYDDFNLFVLAMTSYKEDAYLKFSKEFRKLPLPTIEDE